LLPEPYRPSESSTVPDGPQSLSDSGTLAPSVERSPGL